MPPRRLTSRQLRLAGAAVLAGSIASFALGQALGRQIHPMPGTARSSMQRTVQAPGSMGSKGVGTGPPSPTTTPANHVSGGDHTYIPILAHAPHPAPAEPAALPTATPSTVAPSAPSGQHGHGRDKSKGRGDGGGKGQHGTNRGGHAHADGPRHGPSGSSPGGNGHAHAHEAGGTAAAPHGHSSQDGGSE